jgi:hypothetical protein
MQPLVSVNSESIQQIATTCREGRREAVVVGAKVRRAFIENIPLRVEVVRVMLKISAALISWGELEQVVRIDRFGRGGEQSAQPARFDSALEE